MSMKHTHLLGFKQVRAWGQSHRRAPDPEDGMLGLLPSALSRHLNLSLLGIEE